MKKFESVRPKEAISLFVFGVFSFALMVSFFTMSHTTLAAVTACDSGSNLSYTQAVDSLSSGELIVNRNVDLINNRVTLTVTNNTPCSLPISASSYKMFGPFNLATQSNEEFFYGTETITATPSSSRTLIVNLPTCTSQYDLWYGDAPHVLVDNQSYGSFLMGDQVIRADFCSVPVPATATLQVVKIVINDNGKTKVVSDFPLFVNGTSIVSGVTNTFSAPATYSVTETPDANYSHSFSGDCDVNGNLNLAIGDHKTCILVNNDIAPIIVTIAGTNGTNGTNGINGNDGANGAIGATGTNGTNGATGLTGANGLIGATGLNGLMGANGLAGATGTNGTNGVNGAAGATGANGVTGANGANGATGAMGLTGATGLAGANGMNGVNGATFAYAQPTNYNIVPSFPKTGFPPFAGTSNLLNIVMLCLTLGLPVFLLVLRKRRMRD